MECKNNKNLAKIGGKVRNSVTLYPQNCVSHPQKRDKGLWWSGKYIKSCLSGRTKDGRYNYIETGLPVSIKKNTKGIVIPSEEHTLQMYPMDFEEALPPPCGRACCRRHCGLFLRRLLYSFSILPQGRWSAGLTQRLDLLNPKSDSWSSILLIVVNLTSLIFQHPKVVFLGELTKFYTT